MRQFFPILFILLFASCTTNYYLVSVEKTIPLYETKDTTKTFFFVPAGKHLLIKKNGKKFSSVIYGNTNGYIISREFPTSTSYTSRDFKYLTFKADSTYTYTKYSSPKSLGTSSSGGTVQVKGYYRKDGTYVKPHSRSAPKKKG